MGTRTQEKGAVIPQETDPDMPMSVQKSLAEVWVSGDLTEKESLSVACSVGPFEGRRQYLHYFHHNLASGQTAGREQSPTFHRKIGLMIY